MFNCLKPTMNKINSCLKKTFNNKIVGEAISTGDFTKKEIQIKRRDLIIPFTCAITDLSLLILTAIEHILDHYEYDHHSFNMFILTMSILSIPFNLVMVIYIFCSIPGSLKEHGIPLCECCTSKYSIPGAIKYYKKGKENDKARGGNNESYYDKHIRLLESQEPSYDLV